MSEISAKVIADSISEAGARLTTFELRYPRCILAELNTHRALARNSASSRAIPVEKMIKQVVDDPFIPISWGKNQKGMQAGEDLSEAAQGNCKVEWLYARDRAVGVAERLMQLGLHKQISNRILEPFMWTTTLVTATEWDNFYALRDHPDAEPHMQRLAAVMLEAHNASEPMLLHNGEWHLPYVGPSVAQESGTWTVASFLKFSVARCARVSYLNHDGTAPDPQKDIELHDRLLLNNPKHASPGEHQGRALAAGDRHWNSGNFKGWEQYRKTIPGENIDRHPRFLKKTSKRGNL